MDKQLLAILACPKCKGSVSEADGGKVLFCSKCEIRYPVRNGIPIMALDEARSLKSASENFSGELPTVNFRIIDGPDSNMTFQIEMGNGSGRAVSSPFHGRVVSSSEFGTMNSSVMNSS